MTYVRPTPAMIEGRAMVMHRASGRCEVESPVCDHSEPQWHHRQSRRGGKHGPENGLAACAPCHRFVHNPDRENLRLPWDMGWLVTMACTDPATIPCQVRGQLVTLTHGGTYA